MDVHDVPVDVADDAIEHIVDRVEAEVEIDQTTPVQNTCKRPLPPPLPFAGGTIRRKVRRRLFTENNDSNDNYNNDNDDDKDDDDDDDDDDADDDDDGDHNYGNNIDGDGNYNYNNEYNERKEEIRKLKSCPTVDRFVHSNEIINLCDPLPGHEGASVMMTNVYNTFVHIVKYKNTLLSLQNRKLAIQLRAAEHHLRQLEENNYVNVHIRLPQIVESVFSMWDYRLSNVYINQLKPISCVLNKRYIADHISFRSMEATIKNDSNYIELVFNNPFRFVFVGCASRVGHHKKNTVNIFPFFGEYINDAIGNLYNVMYDMVTRVIKKAKKELHDRQQTESRNGVAAVAPVDNHRQYGLQTMETYSNNKQAHQQQQDTERLNAYLRSVNLPLAKRDNVDILVTSGNSGKTSGDSAKMRYLTVEKNKEANEKGQLKIVDNDITEDAVYMSSYIRCRVLMLDRPAFTMQIYTRHAVKLLTLDDRLVTFSELDGDKDN